AFAAKMKAARAAHRKRRANPGRARVHTAKFDRAVKDIKHSLKKYHRRGNAYAIASARLGEKQSILKRHRRKNVKTGGYMIAAWKTQSKVYYYTGELLNTGRQSAKVYRSFRDAKKCAYQLSYAVPSGYNVAVERA
ncbi:MAG: hypothetical protein ACRETA_14535, partial [Gammaproteobacteria bacterium]